MTCVSYIACINESIVQKVLTIKPSLILEFVKASNLIQPLNILAQAPQLANSTSVRNSIFIINTEPAVSHPFSIPLQNTFFPQKA